MSDTAIVIVGVFVFSLLAAGLILTVVEFHRLEVIPRTPTSLKRESDPLETKIA